MENEGTIDRIALEKGSAVTFCLCSYHSLVSNSKILLLANSVVSCPVTVSKEQGRKPWEFKLY